VATLDAAGKLVMEALILFIWGDDEQVDPKD
jgi:hypothetical protein